MTDTDLLDPNRWSHNGDRYFPGRPGKSEALLSTGVYYIESAPMIGWWLERRRDGFDFPFKIYGNHQHIIDRVTKTWNSTNRDLGVLLNGVKGTGKTVCAKQLANYMADNYQMPIIVLEGYSDLIPTVMDSLQQDCVFFFDEFEKKFPADNGGPNPSSQQRMLSYISGMGNEANRYFFVFTSNNKKLDENMLDRPGRIRYIYEFGDLKEAEVREIATDLLREDLSKMLPDVIGQACMLNTVSIDAVKALIEEVNIHEQTPLELTKSLNLSIKKPGSYFMQILDPDTMKVVKTNREWRVSTYQYEDFEAWMEDYKGSDLSPDSYTGIYTSGMGGDFRLYGPHPDNPKAAIAAIPSSIQECWFYEDVMKTEKGKETLDTVMKSRYWQLGDRKIFISSGGPTEKLMAEWPEILANEYELRSFLLQCCYNCTDINGYSHDDLAKNMPKVSVINLVPDYGKASATNMMSGRGFHFGNAHAF